MGWLPTAVGVLTLLTVLPGPDVAVVTRFAVGAGWRAGLRASGGVVLGLLGWGTLTVLGLAAVLAASAQAYTAVKLAGAVYLVVLGLRAWWDSRRLPAEQDRRPDRAPGRPFRSGLLTNLLNPKIAVFYTGLLPQLVPAGAPTATTATLAALVVVHAGLSLAWLSGCAWVLSRSRSFLSRPRVRRRLERVTGAALVAFGLRVAADAR